MSETENDFKPLNEDYIESKVNHPFAKWAKRFLILLIVAVIVVELVIIWPYIIDSKDEVLKANWYWLAASILSALLAMRSFASVQRRLFISAGQNIKQKESSLIIYAANAISISLPGGQVIAPAFIYNQTRRMKIPAAIASWQLVMSGVLMTIGLAVLGIGGIMFAGVSANPFTILFSVIVCLLIFGLAQFLVAHVSVLKNIGSWGIKNVFKLIKKNPKKTLKNWSSVVDQLTSVKLNKNDLLIAFLWSVLNWIFDVVCLLTACYSIGSKPTILSVIIAYTSSRFLVALVPWIPAGMGALDITIISALISGGISSVHATAAVIIYRFTRYLMIAIIGWIIYFWSFRKVSDLKK